MNKIDDPYMSISEVAKILQLVNKKKWKPKYSYN